MEVGVIKTLKISVTIEDDNGQAIVTNTSEHLVPYIEEIENRGFRAAYHDLENAVFEARKEEKSIEQKCDSALETGGFVCNDGVYENADFKPIKARCKRQSAVVKAAQKLNIKNYNPDDYELPCDMVNISVDDVGVKRQSEIRPKDEALRRWRTFAKQCDFKDAVFYQLQGDFGLVSLAEKVPRTA